MVRLNCQVKKKMIYCEDAYLKLYFQLNFFKVMILYGHTKKINNGSMPSIPVSLMKNSCNLHGILKLSEI